MAGQVKREVAEETGRDRRERESDTGGEGQTDPRQRGPPGQPALRAPDLRPCGLPGKSQGGPEATPDRDCRPCCSRQDAALGASADLPTDHRSALTSSVAESPASHSGLLDGPACTTLLPPGLNQGLFPPRPALLSLGLLQIQRVPSGAWTGTPLFLHTHTDTETHTETRAHTHRGTHTDT